MIYWISTWLSFFCINTHSGKVLRPLPIRWEFPSPYWVKINTDGTTRGYPDLATCGSIFRESMKEFIGDFSAFLEVQTAMVAEFCFMELYMLWRKLKRWSLLMSGLNVILFWFVLCLLLELMFRGCFVIDEILVLIVEKSGLRLLIFFVKGMCVLIR